MRQCFEGGAGGTERAAGMQRAARRAGSGRYDKRSHELMSPDLSHASLGSTPMSVPASAPALLHSDIVEPVECHAKAQRDMVEMKRDPHLNGVKYAR